MENLYALHQILGAPLLDDMVSGVTVALTGYGAMIVVICIAAYWRFGEKIRHGMEMPLSTWALWFLVDLAAFLLAFANGQFSILLLCFSIGTVYLVWRLIRAGCYGVDRFDAVTAVATLAAGIAWVVSDDPFLGLKLMLGAMTIASGPFLLRDVRGSRDDLLAWLMFFCTSVLTYLDGLTFVATWLMLLQGAFILAIAGWLVARRIQAAKVAA